MHSQGGILPTPVRPFEHQQHQQTHISFPDQYPLKVSEPSLGRSGPNSRVGSAMGVVVTTSITSPTDCHASKAPYYDHSAGEG